MAKPWFQPGLTIGSGWVLGDTLGPGLDHVRAAVHSDGRQGVAKRIRGGGGVGRGRLKNEIAAMTDLAGVSGVLPLLESSTEQQAFMITPRAQLLDEHLGPEPNLREVVAAFADLADTLAELHTRGIFHRDLKPANLFWLGGRAVLGDFGLVHGDQQEEIALTATGELMGSIYFMAPEARTPAGVSDWGAVDVYSLTMCLWVIARNERFPLHSTLWGRLADVSLYPVGGEPANDLTALLELATRERVIDRPTMDAFANELHIWLALHESTTRNTTRYRTMGGSLESRAHEGGMEGMAHRSLSQLARAVAARVSGGFGEVTPHDVAGEIMRPPDVTGGNPDFVAEWGPVTLTREFTQRQDVRLILELVGLDDRMGVYLAEWQIRDRGQWRSHWSEQRTTLRSFIRLPSDRELRDYDLAPTIVGNAPPTMAK